ncbi:DUF4412 domain-containing protein [Pedobacter sp. BMA]|uniref:DUF4412 domain-containing protein n=1 Tax=Pedobacter sp. BMA TaxID=1663685 RepID=UPI00064A8DC4|nr:DUF4412 domain-containing protein [Pedobacter sp. BMA]KLT66928.1 hypothetical protein AB669_03110 [Pedobacter sp. BMA]
MLKSIKTSVVALILVSTAIIVHAQKKVTEGTLVFAVTANGSTTDVKTKFNGSLTKLEIENGPALVNIISNTADKTGLLLIDVPVAQKQFAVKVSKSDTEAQEALLPKYSDYKATGEKQTIAGLSAEKYTYKDDKGGAHELWATKDVDISAITSAGFFKGLNAFPVKYSAVINGVSSDLVLKSLSEAKVGAISTEIPAGYDIVTMDELKAMQGGGE